VRQGVITAEEAASRPKTNRITRAIQGHTVQKTKPDIHFISDIEEGDLFFLCSDGILEAVSDADLTDILSSAQTLNEKMEIIHQICEANSRDNFSAYLIEVDAVN
jgi:protein phosphatase